MRGLLTKLAAHGGIRAARRVAGAGVVLSVLILGTGLAASPNQQPAPRDPFILFQQLVPVIQHDRCVNCHGGIDPATAAHPGKAVDPVNDECSDCHVDAVDKPKKGHWHTPPTFDFFVGKDAKALCAQFADFAMNIGRVGFIDHIRNDALIKFAFVGLSAGARVHPPDPPANPPPMTHRAWVDSAIVWHDEGFAACTMDATITQEETIDSDSTHHFGHQPGDHSGEYMDNRTHQKGTRNVRITRLANGQYRADVSVQWQSTGTLIQQVTGPNGLCTNTFIETDAHDGATSGPARVNVSTQSVTGALRYFIAVELPAEQTTQRSSNSHTTTCGLRGVGDAPPSTLATTWPKREFTIEGELLNPNDKRLVGACDEVLVDAEPLPGTRFPCFANVKEPKPLPFIEHVASPSNLDGSSLPVRVHTAWNFIYR